jgi:4-amino-4-deoxy-L-arabinose transferase-like glycosyltransferase
MAWMSWGAWPDAMIDFGRELYVPWRLAQGKTLYRDLAYFNGPLSPYVNSLWFRLFGVHMRTLVVANLCILAAITALLYLLIRRLASRLSATVACLLLLTVFAFGQYAAVGNYNFVTPYAHEMTHGLLLALLGLWLLARHQRRGRAHQAASPAGVVLAGVVTGLLFLTKAEVFLAGAVAVVVGFVLTAWLRRSARHAALTAGAFAAGALLAPLIAFALLASSMPAKTALLGVLGSWCGTFNAELRALPFYRTVSGLDDPGGNLREMLIWLGLQAAFVAAATAVALALPRRRRAAVLIAAAAAAGVVLAGMLHIDQLSRASSKFLVPSPLVLAGIIVATAIPLWRRRHRGHDADRLVLRLSFALFALLLTAKIVLRLHVVHYGFVLAMPAAVVLAVALLDWLGGAIDRRGRAGVVLRAVVIAAIAVFACVHVRIATGQYRMKTVQIATETARFRADPRGAVVNETIQAIGRHVGADQTLVVLPEGVMLNFLTQRRNPTPYVNFMPPELILFGEDSILAAFKQSLPDFLIIANKSVAEYGYKKFGHDYATDLSGWMRQNYEHVRRIERPDLGRRSFTRMDLIRYVPLSERPSQPSQPAE